MEAIFVDRMSFSILDGPTDPQHQLSSSENHTLLRKAGNKITAYPTVFGAKLWKMEILKMVNRYLSYVDNNM